MASKFDYIILDVESYIHKACGVCETVIQDKKDPYIFYPCHDAKIGISYIKTVADSLRNNLVCDQIIFVIGGENNFRKNLNPIYKSHRGRKPVMYEPLLDWLVKNNHVISLPNLEADDSCRIIFEDDKTFNGNKVIVSIDKDFYSVPCTFYRDLEGYREIQETTKEVANMNLYKQILMGDKADGYQGIKGMGEKTVAKLVTPDTTLEDVKNIFLSNGLTEHEFKLNANMAYIIGLDNYNLLKGEVTHYVQW